MTWGEFKRQVQAAGVQDDDEVSYIDWNGGDLSVTIHETEPPSFRVE